MTALVAPVKAACDLKVRTYEFPPLAERNLSGQWTGMDIEFVQALLTAAGCTFQWIDMPWGRAIMMLKAGDVDLMTSISMTPERQVHFYFIGPQRQEHIRFITKKGLIKPVTTWQQFEQLDLALMRQRGTFLGERLNQALLINKKLAERLVILADNDVRIGLLHKDRADGFFSESAYLFHQMRTNSEFHNLDVHPLVIHSAPVYFTFSNASMTLAQIAIMQQVFEQLNSQGVFKRIEAKYTGSQLKP